METADVEIDGRVFKGLELYLPKHPLDRYIGIGVPNKDQFDVLFAAFNKGKPIKMNGAHYFMNSYYSEGYGKPETFYLRSPAPGEFERAVAASLNMKPDVTKTKD